MEYKKASPGNVYQIRVKEVLGAGTLDMFNGLKVDRNQNQGTVLSGWFPDQPALRGVMEYLWNLNLTILSVEIKENEELESLSSLRRKT